MNVLGIGGYSHDSAAALVCDGQLVAGVAEERLTRVKHQGGAPREAVAYCLEAAGLKPGEIDHVGCYMKPGYRMGLPRGSGDRQRHLGRKRSIRGDLKTVNHKNRWLVELGPEVYL